MAPDSYDEDPCCDTLINDDDDYYYNPITYVHWDGLGKAKGVSWDPQHAARWSKVKLEALMFAVFCWTGRLLELFYYVGHLFEGVAFLEAEWNEIGCLLALKSGPVVIGVILLYSIFVNNLFGCVTWVLLEIGLNFLLTFYMGAFSPQEPEVLWTDAPLLFYILWGVYIFNFLLVVRFMVAILDLGRREAALKVQFWEELDKLHKMKKTSTT